MSNLLYVLAMKTPGLLVESPVYRPFIRAAGSSEGPVPPATSRERRAQLCYTLHWFVSDDFDIGWPDGPEHHATQPAAWIQPPGVALRCTLHQPCTLTYVHFTVDQNPHWSEMHPDSTFGLIKPKDRALLQMPPESVWGVALPLPLPRLSTDRVASVLPGIIEDWGSNDRFRSWRSHERFASLLRCVVMDVTAPTNRDAPLPPEARITRAESLAVHNLETGFDVNRMAAAAGYERSYFSTLYRRLRGRSPRDYLDQLRLSEARRLLQEDQLPVADVAALLGYTTPLAFIRMFKRKTGQTPAVWKRSRHDPGRALPGLAGCFLLANQLRNTQKTRKGEQ